MPERKSLYAPAVQATHMEPDVYAPAPHAVHTADVFAPDSVEEQYVPTGQLVQFAAT